MDEKELDQKEEFDLDSILTEFKDSAPEEPEEETDLSALLEDVSPAGQEEEAVSIPEIPGETPALSEQEGDFSPEEDVPQEDALSEDAEEAQPEELTEPEEEFSQEPEDPEYSEEAEEASEEPQDEVFTDPDLLSDNGEEDPDEEASPEPRLYYDPQADLRELKHKLVAGPEKRYYDLTELGVGKLQIAIFINVVLVLLCALGAVLFAAGKVPENRMRLLIFSQVLAMLISGLLGINQIMDGISEIFKGRFSIHSALGISFLACIVDAGLALRDLRVPCCSAFCLQMVLALSSRCQQRNMEMGQMDTLRKAVRLHSLKKVPDYCEGRDGLLRSTGRLEDFMDNYDKSSGPRKLQSFYCFLSFLLCIGISVLAGVLHGPSMSVQIFSASMMVAVPASFFIALTRPAAILERRLHMVGAVLCGWAGIKGLSGKAVFPIGDRDLFPQGSTKLNGIKFYSDRDPDMIVSYTSSLILESGSGLIPIFEQLMNSRGVVANPVQNFHLYEGGGIGGTVCGERVLLGSTEFLQEMGVDIPEGSMVSQAVYAAIAGELCAVVAISFAKMRSAAAGMVTLCGYRKLTPVFVGADFVFNESFIRSKFEINTRRLRFPSVADRTALQAKQPQEELPGLALSTRPDLISFAYAVTGARALRVSCKWGMILNLLGGILGLLSMLVLAITGSTELLTPVNILLYQLVWLVPGLLITEWTRHV